MLKENLKTVEEHVLEACKRAGRSREEVTLIAVSKTKPLEMLQEIYGEGVRDFGENKVQELCDKMEQLPSDIRWHMIGHLQRNKVHQVIGKAVLIHAVDSLRLALIHTGWQKRSISRQRNAASSCRFWWKLISPARRPNSAQRQKMPCCLWKRFPNWKMCGSGDL